MSEQIIAPQKEEEAVGLTSSSPPSDSIEAMQMALIDDYERLLPTFNFAVDGLSSNQMRRLLKALVAVPLTVTEYKPPTIEEKNVFNTGRRLIEVNVILTLSTLTQAINQIDSATLSAEPTTEKKEEENGKE